MNKGRYLATLSYPLWIITAPLYYFKYRENLDIRFHLGQALKIFMTIALLLILWLLLSLFLIMVPLIGPLVSAFLMADILGFGIFFIYLIIRGMFNAFHGVQKELPLVNWVFNKLRITRGRKEK